MERADAQADASAASALRVVELAKIAPRVYFARDARPADFRLTDPEAISAGSQCVTLEACPPIIAPLITFASVFRRGGAGAPGLGQYGTASTLRQLRRVAATER